MSSNFQRIALLRTVRLFDLAVVTLTFVAAFAIANWHLHLAEVHRGAGPSYQGREFFYFWRLSCFLRPSFLGLRLLSIASHEPLDSVEP